MFQIDVPLVSELRERADMIILTDPKTADLFYKCAQRIVMLNRMLESEKPGAKASMG